MVVFYVFLFLAFNGQMMVECRFLRLQAQILSVRFWMTEPEAEESPRYESADEGLASDFARLGLSSSVGQPVQPDSETRQAPALNWQLGWLGNREARIFAQPPGSPNLADLEQYFASQRAAGGNRLEIRYYAVWSLPLCRDRQNWIGLHVGLDSRAYAAILAANQNVYASIRFRRFDNLQTARFGFERGGRSSPS